MNGDNQWLQERAKAHLLESANVKRKMAEEYLGPVVKAANVIADAFRAGRKLLLCGNGGSAADCQHIAAEFVSVLTQNFIRPGLRAIALTTDTSLLTAYTNDFGFDGVFERQVETLGERGDVLLAISTSGNSRNVLVAVEKATELGLRTVGLSGQSGRLGEVVEILVAVPSRLTQHIQEAHITIGHILCDLVERRVFGGNQEDIGNDN